MIMVEDTKAEGSKVNIFKELSPGTNIRKAGIEAGTEVDVQLLEQPGAE